MFGTGPAYAATAVTYSAGNLSIVGGVFKNFVIGCAAGNVTVNAAATTVAVNCADVVNLTVRISPGATPVTNTIDLRPMTAAAFSHLGATSLDGAGGGDRVYGSFVADNITAGGNVFGLAGRDVIRAGGVGNELWGGDADDDIVGMDTINGGRGSHRR